MNGSKVVCASPVAGQAPKRVSSMSDSSSDICDLDDAVLSTDPQIEANMRRLQAEERLLMEQRPILESREDPVALLEHSEALRLNQLLQRQQILRFREQQLLQQQQIHQAQQQALYNQQLASLQTLQDKRQTETDDAASKSTTGVKDAHNQTLRSGKEALSLPMPEMTLRQRPICTIRVNNLAEASLETDV